MTEKRKQKSVPSRGKATAKTVRAKKPAVNAAAKKKAPRKAAVTPLKRAAKKTASKAVAGEAARRLKAAVANSALKVVETALEDLKAVNVRVLDVRKLTDVADTMIIASGNSDRHVRSIADRVISDAKKAGYRPMGVEGERDGEWVLVDLQDVIVHIMLPRIREFYRLENLWDVSAARREAAELATQG